MNWQPMESAPSTGPQVLAAARFTKAVHYVWPSELTEKSSNGELYFMAWASVHHPDGAPTSEPPQRYDYGYGRGLEGMFPRRDGKYVRWEDVAHLFGVAPPSSPQQPRITWAHEVDGPWRLELNSVTLSTHKLKSDFERARSDLMRALAVPTTVKESLTDGAPAYPEPAPHSDPSKWPSKADIDHAHGMPASDHGASAG